MSGHEDVNTAKMKRYGKKGNRQAVYSYLHPKSELAITIGRSVALRISKSQVVIQLELKEAAPEGALSMK